MADLNPKDIVRPLALLVDSYGSPKAFFEASAISVSSVRAISVSADEYTGSGFSLSSLLDVDITTVVNNQVLKWNSLAQKWINSTDQSSGGGANAFGDIGWVQFNDGAAGLSAVPYFVFSGHTLYVSSLNIGSPLQVSSGGTGLSSIPSGVLFSDSSGLSSIPLDIGYVLVGLASGVGSFSSLKFNLGTPTNNQILKWSNTSGWYASDEAASLYSNLSGLNDTSIVTPTNGQALVWNGASWQSSSLPAYITSATLLNYATTASLVNYATTALYATTASLNNYATTASLANRAYTSSLNISSLNDTFITTPGGGQVLAWNGSKWIASSTPSSLGGVTALSSLTDTQITTPTAGKVLAWNGSKWVASSIAISAEGGLAHYGSFTNSATLSATSANAPNYVKYLITEEANGVILAGLTPDNYYSSLKFEHAGTYNIQFSLQVSNTDNAEHFLNIWARINNNDVPRTNTKVTVPKTAGGAIGTVIPAWNYILTLGVDDTFQLMYSVDDTRVLLPAIPALTSPYAEPATPSVIITAQQVMYLQTAADTSASFLTLTTNTGLSQERTFTTGGGLGSYDGGANNNYVVSANYTSAIWQPSSSFGTANQTISALGNFKVNQNLSAATISSTSIISLSSTANTFIETPTTFFASQGDAQNRRFVMRNETALDGTPTSLYIDGSSILAKIPANTIWHVNARVVCRTNSTNAKYAAFERKCLINRNSNVSSTSILGPVQVIGSDIGSDTGSPPIGWDVNLYADSTNGALDIKVTGTDSDTVRWVAEINLVEVAFN